MENKEITNLNKTIVIPTKLSNVWGYDDGSLELFDVEKQSNGIESPVHIYECEYGGIIGYETNLTKDEVLKNIIYQDDTKLETHKAFIDMRHVILKPISHGEITPFLYDKKGDDVRVNGGYIFYKILSSTNPDVCKPFKTEHLISVIEEYNKDIKSKIISEKKLEECFEKLFEKKVYVVESSGGQWSDAWKHIIGIWDNKNEAIKFAEKHWEEHGNFISRLPIPYQTYCKHYRSFDINENEEDENYGEFIFKDSYGYTKEQWEETNKTIETYDCNITSYCNTAVFEYPLNKETTLPRNQIWIKHSNTPQISDWDDDDDFTGEGTTSVNINTHD